jgi:uncharacterized repeat protein (TIGR03943 family)
VLSLIVAIRADVLADRRAKAGRPPASNPSTAPVAGRTAAGRIQGAQSGAVDTAAVDTAAVDTAAVDAAAVAEPPTDDPHAHGHDHDRSRAPWLILLPVLVLLLVAPPALGADAVARNASSQALAGVEVVARADSSSKDGAGGGGGYKFNDGSGSAEDSSGSRRTMHFPPLAEGANPPVGMKDFILRALYDVDNSVQNTPVTVTGFIAPPGQGYPAGYTIARMVISCCAADANPMQLHVDGSAPLPANTWVDAVITLVPNTATMDNGYVPTVTVTSLTPVQQPEDPYEH